MTKKNTLDEKKKILESIFSKWAVGIPDMQLEIEDLFENESNIFIDGIEYSIESYSPEYSDGSRKITLKRKTHESTLNKGDYDMTTLDEILLHTIKTAMFFNDDASSIKYDMDNLSNKAKQQIAQAIEGAKPEKKYVNPNNTEPDFYADSEGYNRAIEEYHQNLLKELGLTNNKDK